MTKFVCSDRYFLTLDGKVYRYVVNVVPTYDDHTYTARFLARHTYRAARQWLSNSSLTRWYTNENALEFRFENAEDRTAFLLAMS